MNRPTRARGLGAQARPGVMTGVVAFAIVVALGLLGAAPVRAQDTGANANVGITVIGYGGARAPAESATLQFVVTRDDYGPPRAPRVGATPGAEERELVGPTVDALRAAGIAEQEIEIVISPVSDEYYGPGGPGVARIDVQVSAPTTDRVKELIYAAVQGAAEENLILGQVGVGYAVEDCFAIEREARELAVRDARERAEMQAEVLGVQLGEPTASRDRPLNETALADYLGVFGLSEGGCAPPTPRVSAGLGITVPPFNPTGEAEVESFIEIGVTFAIAGAGTTG